MAKSPKRVAAGKKSRRKGASNENKIAKQLGAWWGSGEWARTPSSGGWSTKDTREGFKTCGDIISTAEDWPFTCELKKQESWTLETVILNEKSPIWEWWQQTIDETPEGMKPMLIFSRNYIKPLVMVYKEDMPVIGEVKEKTIILADKYAIIPFEKMLETDPERWRVWHKK